LPVTVINVAAIEGWLLRAGMIERSAKGALPGSSRDVVSGARAEGKKKRKSN